MSDGALRCPVCGTPTVPGARFCFHCGTSLDPLATPDAGRGERSAERRVVTVLFGDLSDFTAWAEDLDPERVGVVTDTVLASLASAVSAYGGHVDKLTGDGIMAVFGAPTAHEDDPERAVRAAVQMQSDVRRLVAAESGGGRQLGLRVGLNTGEVLAGVRAALSYTVVGDTVNTASRLSDAAGIGAILAGRDTAVPTLSIASWRSLAPLRLKGKREPVAAYELIGLRPRPAVRVGLGDEAPLIGREAELGLLVGRVHDAVDRRSPTATMLTGAAGVGKTRLWRELARYVAELPGSRVLVGRCSPYGRTRGLAPLVEMVRTASGVAEDDLADVARERVRRLVSRVEHPARGARSPVALADTLLGLLGLADDEPAPRDAAPPGESDRRGEDLVDAVSGLFNALAMEGPLLLVVDDLQWAGDELLEVLATVAERLAGPVSVVGVGRLELLERHASWTPRLPDPVLLPLAPLEESAAERLLRAYLGGSELVEDVRRTLLDRAQGNPFFLAELLHLLVDRGLLRRVDDGWVAAGELPIQVLPAGVHAVLAARIDELPQDARTTLRDASVVGARFWPGALVALSGEDPDEVTGRLGSLLDHEIVRPSGPDAFAFTHTLTREVAYSGLPKAERARRHAIVATWADAQMPGGPAEVDLFVAAQAELAATLAEEMSLALADPAWHAARTGVAALVRLGRAHLVRDDNQNAAEVLGRALTLAGGRIPDDLDAEVRVGYAQALAALHRLDDALAALAPVLDRSTAGEGASALVVLGDIRRKQGADSAAAEAFVRALSAAGDAGDDRVVAEALRQLGLLDYFAGRLRSAEKRFVSALELARRVGDQRGTGWALQHLAWSATTRGDYALADDSLRQAAEAFTANEDEGGLSWCAGTQALVRLLEGRLSEARSLARHVLGRARETGDRWATAACLTIDAMAGAELGDVALAAEQSVEATAVFEELGDTWGQSLGLLAQGMAARNGGHGEEAVRLLSQAESLADRLRHPTIQSLALVVLGWCHWEGKDLDAAESDVRRALALAEEVGLADHAATGERVLLGLVQRSRGNLADALAILGEVAHAPTSPTLLFPMRQALAHHAATLLEAGRPEDALAEARRAMTVPAEDARSQVIALRALGSALLATGQGDDARGILSDALAVATGTQHVREAGVTRRLLDSLGEGSRPASA
ncbi:MAG TPA: adenylate/guanylate cyclase domain-containing protein [Mycobacteriales bacterium]|nr:adenylate/guanylate cyclase domain-containing protein [Mycobacteriales bacterium]